MSRFKRIKNKTSKKSSVSINEKISTLNKELKKTGILKEGIPTNSSRGIYSTSTHVPADPGGEFPIPDTTGVTGAGFVQPVSGNPNDSSNWPDAYTDNSWMFNSNEVYGETNRPIIASFDDALFSAHTASLTPGSSPQYPTGGAGIAFGNQGFGVSVGYIRNGFYHQVLKPGLLGGTVIVPQDASGSPYFGLFGEYFPAGPERQALLKSASARYAAVNVAGATTIDVKAWTPFNSFHMGSYDNYSGPKFQNDSGRFVLQTFKVFTASNTFFVSPTPATTTNPIIRGIGDIEYHGPITPGRLFGLSDQGYNYLDNKSRRRLRGRTVYRTSGGGAYPTTGRTTTFTTGSRLRSAQPIADPTTTTQTQQSPPEESEPPNIPAPQSSPDKPFSTSNPTPPPDIPPLPAPKPQPGNYEGRPGRILDPTGLDQRAIELGYNDELYPVHPDRFYTTQVELGQDILSSLMNAEFYSAASRGESPNYNNAEINKAKADLAKYRKNLDNWNRWKQNTGYTWKGAVSDREYDKQKALEKELKDKELDKQIDQLEKDKAQNEADAEAAATEARNLIAQFGLEVALTLFGPGILKLAGNALGKLPAVAKFFKLSKAAQKAQIDDALRGQSSKIPNIFRNAKNLGANDVLDQFKKTGNYDDLFRLFQRNEPLSTSVKGGQTTIRSRTGDILKIYDRKLGKFVDPPAFRLGASVELNQDKLLNEAAKLGHFEPEELNVDIEKLRKGIMPEYPKKPPAKMIDGYHQDSKLKPKELNKEPYLKIDEKDLIRNHRLKPNEAHEMMQTIDRINDHIKEHPEDLIHAQMRYPIDDPRLAELNWRMDQMLDAGEEYLDTNFKVNDKLFKRAIDRTKKNIKLTDPEYVQQHYDELRGTTKPKKTKLVGRLGKHLNKYESKSFFKHVNSKDFKKISERKEQQKQQKLLKLEEEKYLDSVMKQVKYSWREYDAAAELREGMTTSNLTVTTIAAQGEGEDSLATLDMSVADSFSDNTDRDAPPSGLKDTAITDGGTGTGSNGGFDIGPHVRFDGNSQPRWATLNAVDTSSSDTIVLSAIRGSDFNGGEIPDLDNEALQLWYYDSSNRAWRPLNQNPLGATDNTVNHIIIPNVPGEGGIPPEDKILRDWTLTLPSWARGSEMKFMFYQSNHSGGGYDHYGLKSVSYRRNTPLTVFAPLDSPEASAFIRMNPITYRNRYKNIKDRFAPRKQKKNLEKMLEASDKYVATYLGPDFPGMNTEITPITMQTFEQQSAAMDARDDLVNKVKSLSDIQTEKYENLVSRKISPYHYSALHDSINELNNFGQSYQNAIDTQNYDEANRLVQNTSKNVIRALGGQLPVFDKSGEVSLAPVTDKYGRTYNPKYELTQEQIAEIDRRYGVTTEAAMRTANESPYSYTLDLGMDNVGQMFDELLNRYDVDEEKLEKGYTYSSVYGDRIYSNRRATVGKEDSNKSTGHWTPWYGGKGYKMFRGDDKPTTWDGVGWYPSRVGTNHWQGHRYDGLAYGAFFRIYVGDGLSAQDIRYGRTERRGKNANGRSDAANLAYYLNFSGSSSYFAERWTETVERKNAPPIVIDRMKLGTQRDGMTYFHSWYQSIDRLRAEYGKPPLTNDPFLDALRKEQEENPNFAEPIEQSIDGQIKDENTDPDSLADELTELEDFLPIEDMDGFTADELEDMGIMWKGMLNDKPKRDDYDNTRSGAKKFSDDLKAYKQNQEIIAKNTKLIDYHRNTLASIASRDENGKFDPEKYKANFKEGENSFYINAMDYDFGKVSNLLGSASESNPFGANIGAFDKENTLAYDYSNGVNLGLSSQNMADLFGGGRKIVTAANGKSYTKFGDLDWEYKEDAINAYNAFSDSETKRLFADVDFENLSFGDNIFSTQQAFRDHLSLERAKSMTALNLMSVSLHNRLVEVENGFTPVLGSKQDFGAMSDAGVKVSGQSFPADTNFDLVPVDSEGFFTREFNANLDKPKGSNLTYTQIAQLNGQLDVVVNNGMNRLYKAQARGASEEELGAIAASIWQAEKPISDKLALDYDSMFSPDGKISPTLNSILNNPLSNAIKSLADVVTFDTFDIDNKGRSTNPIVNKINSSVRQLPGDAAMFIRYLTNTGPKVIDNKALGEKRVETMFRNAETKGGGENALKFNDNIAGTTQEPVYKNGKINIAFNYDFEKNATEFQTAKENNAYVESWAGKIMKSITGSDNLGNKILEPLTKAMYNVMGEYSVDAQPSFPVVGTILGPIFGQAIETSKSVGGAKAIPGNVSITPKELYRINPNLYREYVSKGVIPDTERDYYGGYNTGSRIIPYDQAPYFFKDKKKKDEGTFDVDMNYFPPGFEDAIRTDQIGVTQGQFMPSNPQGMRQQGVGVSANDLSRNQTQSQINAALRKMMDRHDAALRKLKASQLNPNDKKSMDAVEKLVLAQERERRPLVKALEIKPEQQGEPIFPSVAASTLTTAQSNALLDKGAEVERVADFLNLGATNKELNDLTKDIKVASHTIDKPLPKKLPSFGLKFKASLLSRYLTGNNKQFTEKDLDNAQIQSMYNQTDQILRAGDSRAFGTENGVAVEDLTNQMSEERKKKYGMEPGDKIYAVSSYTGDNVLQPLENNDLIYVLGRYVVITKPGTEYGAPTEKIKEIRDDYDFEYGFNAVRADGGVPGDDTIIGRVKGDETPGTPGTLTKGKGIFGGGAPSELGITGAEPISTLTGRTIVNISQGLGIGKPFPIRIKFTDQNYKDAWKYEDDYPVYESKEPTRGETLYEKVKKKVFFNPKDIKPEFPKDPPPELDPETGMHPEYGKHVSRYKKLDPHSADAMPDTGDPEIDAEVMKQKSGKKKKKLSDFKRNIK